MARKFYYGGQAVIEGVMMRGRRVMATAVRRPGGGLSTRVWPLSTVYTGRLRQAPFLRGIIVLIEAMVLGIKSLLYSANVSLEEVEEEISGRMVWVLMVTSMAFAVTLFFIIPLFLTRLIDPYLGSSLVFNLTEGLIRMTIFLADLKLISLVPDIKRVFAYHGAEHKTVNAHEAGVPLEVAAVRDYNTTHIRCGTSFLFVVMMIAIMVFTLVGRPSIWLMVVSRITLIPVIAAISYELIYLGANHHRNSLVKVLVAPGLWLQKLTTREPDDSQLEVAVSALKKVVEADQEAETALATP